jgi:hypothetical protein
MTTTSTVDTSVITYYPNIKVNSIAQPQLYSYIEASWDLRTTGSGPLDTTRVHIFKSHDTLLSKEIYMNELGILPYHEDLPDDAYLWFTKAIPGWRSGIQKHDYHWMEPAWNISAEQLDPLAIPIRDSERYGPSIFIPIRDCDDLVMEIYEPILANSPIEEYSSSPRIAVSDSGDKSTIFKTMVPTRASLVSTVTFDQSFSYNTTKNWIQFVNKGHKHAVWLEIFGGGVKSLLYAGNNSWIDNKDNTEEAP